LRSRFSSDFAAITERISHAVVAADGGDAGDVGDHVRSVAEPWLEYQIRSHYGGLERLRALRNRLRRLRSSVTRDRRNVRKKLRQNGAAEEYVATFESELARIEETLNGDEFRGFLARLPGVMASPLTSGEARGPGQMVAQ
jgi:hypothetical protein